MTAVRAGPCCGNPTAVARRRTIRATPVRFERAGSLAVSVLNVHNGQPGIQNGVVGDAPLPELVQGQVGFCKAPGLGVVDRCDIFDELMSEASTTRLCFNGDVSRQKRTECTR